MAKALRILVLLLGLTAASQSAIGASSDLKWAELSAEQRFILAPLESEWSRLDTIRKQKWLRVAKRYPAMRPEEQFRLRQNMAFWASLTPEERTQARENFKEVKHLPTNKKVEKWEQYQSLPPETKQQLATIPSTRSTKAGAKADAAPSKEAAAKK